MPRSKPIGKVKPHHQSATLIDRNQARLVLGVSYSTILNLERRGDLTPVRLSNLAKAKVFFRLADVMALAGKPTPNVPLPPSAEPIDKTQYQYPSAIIVDGRKYALIDQK